MSTPPNKSRHNASATATVEVCLLWRHSVLHQFHHRLFVLNNCGKNTGSAHLHQTSTKHTVRKQDIIQPLPVSFVVWWYSKWIVAHWASFLLSGCTLDYQITQEGVDTGAQPRHMAVYAGITNLCQCNWYVLFPICMFSGCLVLVGCTFLLEIVEVTSNKQPVVELM